MKCYGKFTGDRVCDLCNATNTAVYAVCKAIKSQTDDKQRLLRRIRDDCPYRTKCYDDRDEFDGCNKNGNGHGKYAEDCRPSEECIGFMS